MSFINYTALYRHNVSVHGIAKPLSVNVNVKGRDTSNKSRTTSENQTKSRDVQEMTTSKSALIVDGELFKVYYPKKSTTHKTFNDTTPCPSCGKHLPCQSVEVKSPEFYDHCVKDCLKNREKGETSIHLSMLIMTLIK